MLTLYIYKTKRHTENMPKLTWLETHWLSGTVMMLCLSTVKDTNENNCFFLSCLPHCSATAPVVECRMYVYTLVKIHCIYIYIHTHTLSIRGSVPTEELRCLKVSFHNTSSSPEGNPGPKQGSTSAPCSDSTAEPLCMGSRAASSEAGSCPVPAQWEPSCLS